MMSSSDTRIPTYSVGRQSVVSPIDRHKWAPFESIESNAYKPASVALVITQPKPCNMAEIATIH